MQEQKQQCQQEYMQNQMFNLQQQMQRQQQNLNLQKPKEDMSLINRGLSEDKNFFVP